MKGKKILFITPAFNKGGAENQLFKLAAYLTAQGYTVEILSFLNTNDFEEKLNKLKIKFTLLNAKGKKAKLMLVPNTVKYAGQSKPDLIISFMFAANLVARIVKLVKGIPLITSVRNNEISKKYYWLYKATYRIDNATVYNSPVALNKFINLKITDPAKSSLINNAIEIPAIPPVVKASEPFRWISIAHFRPQKDYRTLFEAMKILKATHSKIELTVLGHTFGQEWPVEYIKELGLTDEVNIIGFVSDPSTYIQKANALVLSSLWEGTPNAILEAMSYNLPIVASAIPGSSELIDATSAGFLFETKDAHDLAAKMSSMMALNTANQVAMGERGFKYVSEHFEAGKIHKQWHSVIENALTVN